MADEHVPEVLLRTFSAEQLAILGPPRYQWLTSVTEELKPKLVLWKIMASLDATQPAKRTELATLALRSYFSLAVDIESDGEKLWEIGTATRKTKSLLLSRNDAAGRLQDASQILAKEIGRSKVVIGHNILAWDRLILSRLLPETDNLIFWDTLLVAFMLDPWKASHALGGSHQADEDAQDAFRLFESQIERIGGNIGLRLLSGEIQSTSVLMKALGELLQTVAWTPPSFPADLDTASKDVEPVPDVDCPSALD